MVHWSQSLQATKSWLLGTIVIVVVTCVIMLTSNNIENTKMSAPERTDTTKEFQRKSTSTHAGANHTRSVHVAVVVCGDRLEEGLVLLKSAVIFSKTQLIFHIFTEDDKRKTIMIEIERWPRSVKDRLKTNLYKVQYPATASCPDCKEKDWKNLFLPCASQRLFIPDILTDVDSVIYIDADTLFLSPLEDVWFHFFGFNSNQIFGIVPELSGWYSEHPIPCCTETGANSGVLLMNLTRIRRVKWMVKINEYFKSFKKVLQLWDQDLMNIYCHFHPGQVYVMPCLWNYRGIFCPSDGACQEGEKEGAHILHGNSMMFHIDKMPAIREVYFAIKEQNLTRHNLQDLLDRIESKLQNFSTTECGKRPQIFTKHLQKYILETSEIAKSGMALSKPSSSIIYFIMTVLTCYHESPYLSS